MSWVPARRPAYLRTTHRLRQPRYPRLGERHWNLLDLEPGSLGLSGPRKVFAGNRYDTKFGIFSDNKAPEKKS